MRFFKRLISFIVTLTMVFSLSTVAFAAEFKENASIATNEVSMNRHNVAALSTNSLITQLTGYYTGGSATTISIPITVTGNGSYLYISILTEGPVRASLYSNGVKVSTTYIQQNKDDVQWCQIKLDRHPDLSYWAAGNYTLKVEILFNYKYTFTICGTQDELPV